MAKAALEKFMNNQNEAVQYLLKLQEDGAYDSMLGSLMDGMWFSIFNSLFYFYQKYFTAFNQPGASTSNPSGASQAFLQETISKTKNLLEHKKNEAEAYNRFKEDINSDEDDYLDLPLIQEENLVLEYKRALNMLW